jgi:hypothetical protein
LAGLLTVTIDGTARTSAAINLSAATSFSSAAQIVTVALGLIGPTQASFTGSYGATFTGAGSGTNLTATAVVGTIHIGSLITGTGSPAATIIVSQTSGTTGGAGVYVTSNVTTSAGALTSLSAILDVSAVASGSIVASQQVLGTGVQAGTVIVSAQPGATGGVGSYVTMSPGGVVQQIASTAMTTVVPVVTYDSIAAAFVVISSTTGTISTIGFASGTISAALALTQATGATLSQGAVASTPGGAMNAIVAKTQDFACFTTAFEPTTADCIAFSAWTNSTVDRFVYVMWDTDITVTTGADSASSGAQIIAANYSGTIPVYEPTNVYLAAFTMGAIASIDFTERNGRTNLKFKNQTGILPGVTDQTISAQLELNGYNYYGAWATANDRFLFFAPGSITGPFKWIDSYVNQIWLNNAFQLAMLSFMTQVKSIPYNDVGYASVEAALMDPITQGLNFGAFYANVPLSAAQIDEVNNAAGIKIDGVLGTRGWYLQVLPATPQVRAARGSPPVTFWYMDGQSINKINLASINVQ